MLYNILAISIVLIGVIVSIFLAKYLSHHVCPHCGAFIKHPEKLHSLNDYCYKCHRYFKETQVSKRITRKTSN